MIHILLVLRSNNLPNREEWIWIHWYVCISGLDESIGSERNLVFMNARSILRVISRNSKVCYEICLVHLSSIAILVMNKLVNGTALDLRSLQYERKLLLLSRQQHDNNDNNIMIWEFTSLSIRIIDIANNSFEFLGNTFHFLNTRTTILHCSEPSWISLSSDNSSFVDITG